MGPIIKLFDDAGYIGVVATNCEQTYHRYLQPGEQVSITAEMGDVIGPKQTALGEGYFINQHIVWRVGDEDVAEMNWRILKFKPAADTAETSVPEDLDADAMMRRPVAVDPVKVRASSSGCPSRVSDISRSRPVTTVTTSPTETTSYGLLIYRFAI